MNEVQKKFISNTRLILTVFVVEKLLGMVNMTWVEVLVPLYILIIFCITYLIQEFWKS